MDNVNRAVSPGSTPRIRLRSALGALRSTAVPSVLRRVVPSRAQLLFPWSALRRRPHFALSALLVLFALIGIVTAVERGAAPATRVLPLRSISELPNSRPPDPYSRQELEARVRFNRRAARLRPGLMLRSVPPSFWLRKALALPPRDPGAPLAAYQAAAARLGWLCTALILAALALLPAAVAAARRTGGDTLAPDRPWLWWRVGVAPVAVAGGVLLAALTAALEAEAPRCVVVAPAVQAMAHAALVAAIVVLVSLRVRPAGTALALGYGFSLAASLAIVPAVAALTAWLTGWAAVLPDPETPEWILGGVIPALYALMSLCVVGVCLHLAAGRAEGPLSPAREAAGGRRRTAARFALGALTVGVGLAGVRLAFRTLPGDLRPQQGYWWEPLHHRAAQQPVGAPNGMRRAFREFAAGQYERALQSLQPIGSESLVADDRRLLTAACLLARGDVRGTRKALGGIRSQYGAALVARGAAALRIGGNAARASGLAAASSLAAFHPAGGEAATDEAAGLEPLVRALEGAEYLTYSPRRAAYYRVPYRLFPRAGQVALRVALLRRLAVLRTRDDSVRVRLAHLLVQEQRLLTESPIREIREMARAGLEGQWKALAREALAANPRNTAALVLLDRLDDAIALRPDDAEFRRLRIRRALESDDNTHLAEDAQRLVDLTRDDDARYALALAHIHLGAPQTGMRELDAMLEAYSPVQRPSRPVPPTYPVWTVSYALLCCREGRLAEARAALERRPESHGPAPDLPIDPATLLALLRWEVGDREGVLAAIHESTSRPPREMLAGLLRAAAQGESLTDALRWSKSPANMLGPPAQSLAWEDQGVSFDLEPIARAILRRDRRSLLGRYLLADALAAHISPAVPNGRPPDAAARRALALFHDLTLDYPGWVAPYERIAAICMSLGYFDRAAAYQRMVGDLYADRDRGRLLPRGFYINPPRPGVPGSIR